MKRIAIVLFFAAAMCAADFAGGQAARLVIGQPTFTSQDSNSSDTILGGASGLAYAADTLFVADSNRVGVRPAIIACSSSRIFPACCPSPPIH